MERFQNLTATACPLGLANVDTDQLIPARFMKTPRAAGYGGFLLHDLRAAGGVYALWDYGVRCVVAPSFGDIFASNAVKNGLLPAVVTEPEVEALLAALAGMQRPEATVDLEARRISCGALEIPFAIDPVRRLQLLNGWDDLDLTERHRAEIGEYRARRAAEAPWAFTPQATR
jgi:3-isopropylmalate/(R)-2-methylmalate dehydratase small subunit